MSSVELTQVVKRYGDVEVVHGVDLSIEQNEFIVLVGPSGCGKSTILRMIAGLEEISDGSVKIGGKVVNAVAPKHRNIAMVFQNYALYPHMTVYDNMAFSLKMQKRPKDEIDRKVNEAAVILGLSDFLKRKPAALSGGQRQRVAMGRAIVRRPDVFLFDEPLSNLDAQLRTQMRMEIKKLHLQLETTTVYVTHDQVEAMTLADRIVILKDGHIQQIGTPIEVYEQPKNMFVSRFIGNPPMNHLEAVVQKKSGACFLNAGGLKVPVPQNGKSSPALTDGQQVVVGLRPDAIFLTNDHKMFPDNWHFDGQVVVAEIIGGTSLLEVVFGGNEMVAEIEGRVLPRPGEKLNFAYDLKQMHIFDPASQAIIH